MANECDKMIARLTSQAITACFTKQVLKDSEDWEPGTLEGFVWERRTGELWRAKDSNVFFGLAVGAAHNWIVYSECSYCRTEFCKHVAAVMRKVERDDPDYALTFQRRHRAGGETYSMMSAEDAIDHWFRNRGRAASTQPAVKREQNLWFVLDTKESHFFRAERRVHVFSAISAPIKTGMAKLRYLERDRDEMSEEYLYDDAYRQFYAWAKGNSIRTNRTVWASFVRDASGLHILRYLISNKRLVCEDDEGRPSSPVSWGEKRPLRVDWVKRDDGHVDVTVAVEGGGLPYFGTVPLYVDHDAREVGLLDLQGVAARTAEQWSLGIPPIKMSWIEKNARTSRVREMLPPVPTHVVAGADRVIKVAPVPVLRIDFAPNERDAEFDVSFLYEDQRQEWSNDPPPMVEFKIDAKLIELHRDPAAESAALAALREAGLLPKMVPAGAWGLAGEATTRTRIFAGMLANDFAVFRAAGFEIEKLSGWSGVVTEVADDDVELGWMETASADGTDSGLRSHSLDFTAGFRINGKRIDLLPLLPMLLASMRVLDEQPSLTATAERIWSPTADGSWIGLPRNVFAPWLAAMAELIGEGGTKYTKAIRGGKLALSTLEAIRVELMLHPGIVGDRGIQILKDLHGAKACTDDIEIPGFVGTLRSYQASGVHWLDTIARHKIGGVLGDEQGIGKTVQTIAHILAQKNAGLLKQPVLIVAPASVVGQWHEEIAQFAPSLVALQFIGTGRHRVKDTIGQADIVLSTYQLIGRDKELLKEQLWHAIVLDEAQNIKNDLTIAGEAVRELTAGYRIALTGTMFENKLLDVWSAYDAVVPGYLGTKTRFNETFAIPAERNHDTSVVAKLRQRTSPFFLRRTKKEVAPELPDVISLTMRLEMGERQANLYETVRLSAEKSVRQVFEEAGVKASRVKIFEILRRLQQVALHPMMSEPGQRRGITDSAKLEGLMAELATLLADGHKVLVFCSLSSFLTSFVEPALKARGIKCSVITGDTELKHRPAQIRAFEGGETDVFLIGLKAGGTGLNLTRADTVIHCDHWWNPQAAEQATARAHRIGQKKTVTVVNMVTVGTIDERALQIQDAKRAMFSAIIDGTGDFEGREYTEDEYMWMLKPVGDDTPMPR